MTLLAAANSTGTVPLAVAAVLGALGVYWLLPKPKNHSPALGTFSTLAALIVFGVWLGERFGPVSHDVVEALLFGLFSGAAIISAGVFVTQRNPARGAIGFAFVIVSVCGLFLLLAAPFLMAATIVVYAGAIIVTFLFVLMLSQTRLASDENDRTREPLLGSLAGFSFLGLVLFALVGTHANAGNQLPARPITPDERTTLAETVKLLREPPSERDPLMKHVNEIRRQIAIVVGGPDAPRGASNIPERLHGVMDHDATLTLRQAERFREIARQKLAIIDNKLLNPTYTPELHGEVKAEMNALADEATMLAARGELPARNVANLGYALYSEDILAVELAGAVLLVATIGAVQIASRKPAKAGAA